MEKYTLLILLSLSFRMMWACPLKNNEKSTKMIKNKKRIQIRAVAHHVLYFAYGILEEEDGALTHWLFYREPVSQRRRHLRVVPVRFAWVFLYNILKLPPRPKVLLLSRFISWVVSTGKEEHREGVKQKRAKRLYASKRIKRTALRQ